MRETRTCSLSGGRRPARKRASSDPTAIAVVRAIMLLMTSREEVLCVDNGR